MRNILVLILAVVFSVIAYGQETKKPQLELVNFKEDLSEGGAKSLFPQIYETQGNKWPADFDGNPTALIRVKFENMTAADARNANWEFGNDVQLSSAPVDKLDSDEHEIWLFVTASRNTFLRVSVVENGNSKYGLSNRLSNLKLEEKHVYDVVLRNNKTMTITFNAKPEGVVAYLPNLGVKKTVPADFTNVPLGKQFLELSLDGRMLKRDTIEVSESSIRFDKYDFRGKKKVKFTSDPSGAQLMLNGENIGTTPMTVELAFDSYNVEAIISSFERDARAITVNANSSDEIKLEPVQKKTFEVYATYGGSKVSADLYVDGKQVGTGQQSYTITKPIGKSYNMRMQYYANGKDRKIRVKKDMAVEQEFKIKARNTTFAWWWEKEYDYDISGIDVGYVTKQLVTTGEGIKQKENGVWDDGIDKSLHGMQFGFHLNPCFSWGLGLYTGLYYELYISNNSSYDYNEFVEHDLYIPVHGYYRIPFARKVSLSLHGGVGFSCAVHGAYSDSDDLYEPYTDFYGEEPFPKRFNITGEIGVGLRIGPVQVSAQYSKGILDHKSYSSVGDYKTVQNKMTLSVSYVIGNND